MKFIDGWLRRLLTPLQVKAFLVTLIISVVMFLGGTAIPISSATAHSLATGFNTVSTQILSSPPWIIWYSILINNVRIAYIEAIPLFGILVLVYSMVSTGVVLNAMVIAGILPPHLSSQSAAVSLFLFPHSIVEFSAYALAASSSFVFLRSIVKKKMPFKEAGKTFLWSLLAVLVLLAVAAFLETLLDLNVIIAGLMWFPIVYITIKLHRAYNDIQEGLYNTR